MTQELKPCPFCGSRALYELHQTIDGFEVPVMFCDMCKAMFTVEGAEDWVTGERDGMDELRSAWNTRAEQTCTNTKMDGSYFRCSRCHATFDMLDDEGEPVIWWNDRPQFNSYCPNCGAKVVE